MRLAATLLALCLAGCKYRPSTPLEEAAMHGDVAAVRAQLAGGADVNATGSVGGPLHTAARFGNTGAIAELARRGADVNLRCGRNGWTPLMHAIHKNRHRSVAALIDAGADPNASGSDGSTPLMMAAGYGQASIVRTLLDRGADPRIELSGGDSALTAAIGGVPDIDRFTVGSCQTETVKALLDAAPDLTWKSKGGGWISLLTARLGGCTEVVRMVENRRRK